MLRVVRRAGGRRVQRLPRALRLDTAIWMDCGNGTFAHLQEHVEVEDLDAVVITHEHPDHCVDMYGLHVLLRYGLERRGFPMLRARGARDHLGQLVDGDWGDTFDWNEIDERRRDGGRRHRRCGSRAPSHPPPTYAVEATADGKRHDVHRRHRSRNGRVGAFEPGCRPRAVGGHVPPRPEGPPTIAPLRAAKPASGAAKPARSASCSRTCGRGSTGAGRSPKAPTRSASRSCSPLRTSCRL